MYEFINAAVSQQPELSLKLIEGGHHRIMKTGWFGSLWIVKTAKRGYRVETTGNVGAHLNSDIKNLLGRNYDRETVKGYKIWFVDEQSKVVKIIEVFGKI